MVTRFARFTAKGKVEIFSHGLPYESIQGVGSVHQQPTSCVDYNDRVGGSGRPPYLRLRMYREDGPINRYGSISATSGRKLIAINTMHGQQAFAKVPKLCLLGILIILAVDRWLRQRVCCEVSPVLKNKTDDR